MNLKPNRAILSRQKIAASVPVPIVITVEMIEAAALFLLKNASSEPDMSEVAAGVIAAALSAGGIEYHFLSAEADHGGLS